METLLTGNGIRRLASMRVRVELVPWSGTWRSLMAGYRLPPFPPTAFANAVSDHEERTKAHGQFIFLCNAPPAYGVVNCPCARPN